MPLVKETKLNNKLPEWTVSEAVPNINICVLERRLYHREQVLKYNDIGNGWKFVLASS